MEKMLTNPLHPSFTWQEFVRSWRGRDSVIYVRYEDLLDDAVAELKRVIAGLGREIPSDERIRDIVDKYSFKRIGGRNPGTEDKGSFLRKGIAGDWKNYFTREAREVFDHYAGEELVALGYEPDRRWANNDR